MSSKCSFLCLTLIGIALIKCISPSLRAQEEEKVVFRNWELTKGLRDQREAFDLVSYPANGDPLRVELPFGKTVATVNGVAHDGFRFKVPLGYGGMDWVWYFEVPESAGSWYISNLTEAGGGGFRVFARPDFFYEGFGTSESEGWRRLQPLDTSVLKEGHEYVVWFRLRGPAKEGDRLVALSVFAPNQDRWPKPDMEAALRLKPVK